MAANSDLSESYDQSSAIPFRRYEGQLQFCVITTISKGRWGFPKGIIDPGDTYIDTALNESLEEAGLHGKIVGEPLGSYQYTKWGRSLNVIVVLMEVSKFESSWLESDVRQRKWATPHEVRDLLNGELLDLFDVAMERLMNSEH